MAALEVLDYCYRQDDDQTQQLLTCELQNWSGQTCLSLAVAANHRALLAHPCSQIILADLWMGGLRTRKNTNIKVGAAPGSWAFVHLCAFLGDSGPDLSPVYPQVGVQVQGGAAADAANHRRAFGAGE